MHQSVTALRASPFLELLLPGLRDNSAVVQLRAVPFPRQLCWEAWARADPPFLWELLLSWHTHAWLQPELQHQLCRSWGCAWPWAPWIQTWTKPQIDFPASPQTCLNTTDLAGSHWDISDLGQRHRTWSHPWFTDSGAQPDPTDCWSDLTAIPRRACSPCLGTERWGPEWVTTLGSSPVGSSQLCCAPTQNEEYSFNQKQYCSV